MYLKGDRCYTDKCAIERRPYPPGQHGQGRVKFSGYGVQLREKQKVKRMYGLLESQFRGYFARPRAPRARPARTSSSCWSCGWTTWSSAGLCGHPERGPATGPPWSLPGERQAREHPFLRGEAGHVVEVAEKSRKMIRIAEALETVDRRGVPQWLEVDKKAFKGTVKSVPNREDLTMPIQEQLIVELYSK